MPHVKHQKLLDKTHLLKLLQKHSKSEVAEMLGVPYSSVSYQVRTKFTESEKASTVRKRFSFTEAEKKAILKECDKTSVSAVSRKYGIYRTQLQHWKKSLQSRIAKRTVSARLSKISGS